MTTSSKPDSSSIGNFSAANGYPSGSYSHNQAHKSAPSASQPFPHAPTVSQSSSYPNQFSSQNQFSNQSQPNQFPPAGQQFPGTQTPFPPPSGSGSSTQNSGPSQYLPGQSQFTTNVSSQNTSQPFPPAPSVTQGQFGSSSGQYNYQSSSGSFQTPVTQSGQSSLYPNTTQTQPPPTAGTGYPSGSASFHVRDSQSSGGLSQSSSNHSQTGGAVSQATSAFTSQQPPAAPGLSKANTTQSPSSFNTQTYSAQHSAPSAPGLQATQLSNKLNESLSKMSLSKDSSIETRSSQVSHCSFI